MSLELRPIGFVRTDAEDLPRHWSVSDVEGTLVIDEEYSEGLRDIEAGQRIVVIFHFHSSPQFSPDLLRQMSGQDGRERGVFSICSPVRPNPIGMSVVEVLGTRNASIDVRKLEYAGRHAHTRHQAPHRRQQRMKRLVSRLDLALPS